MLGARNVRPLNSKVFNCKLVRAPSRTAIGLSRRIAASTENLLAVHGTLSRPLGALRTRAPTTACPCEARAGARTACQRGPPACFPKKTE
eukprot:4678395-Pleurochrysis_carterae.AAC.2